MTLYRSRVQQMNHDLYRGDHISKRVIRAKQFIDDHYSAPLCLEIICEQACLSRYHFIRSFKRLYGRTPHRYLTEVRVEKAKQMIRAGITVREACFSVGYDSVASFSTLFRKVTGSAPSRLDRDKRAIFDKQSAFPINRLGW